MKRFYNKFLIILLCICLLVPTVFLSGCDEENFSVYFGAETEPKNLDPQKAQSYGELLAVRNLYRGLFKEDKDGNIIYDLAESHTVSRDKLTYTFIIKESKWNDETNVTAEDFKFGIERAKSPDTASPSVKLLDNIASVTASDSKTLIFKLVKPDSTFTTLLTSAVFMPCNQKFFEKCGGKYGLNKDNILTNGNYKIAQWTEERSIKLSLTNPDNFDHTTPLNIFISISATGKNSIERIKDDEIGFTVNNSQDYTVIDQSKYDIFTLYNKSYVLVFNKNSEIGRNELLTSSFAKSISKEYYTTRMNKRYKVSSTVLPDDCKYMFNAVNQSENKYAVNFNTETARDEFLTAINDFDKKKLPQINVLYSGSDDIKTILSDVVAQWQRNLGAYVNISQLSESDLTEKVKAGNFTVALIPLTGNAYEILSMFSEKESGMYLNNTEFDAAVHSLFLSDDTESAQKYINECLKILSTATTVIPIVSIPTAFVYSKNYEKFNIYKADGTVDFLNFNKIK